MVRYHSLTKTKTLFRCIANYKSIKVDFIDDDPYGAITAHIYLFSRNLSPKRSIFSLTEESYIDFSRALENVIGSELIFNTV